MNVAVLVALVAAAPGVIGAFLAYRQATRASTATARMESNKVDAEAFVRAKGIYEAGIAQLERQILLLRDDLNQERDAAKALKVRAAQLEATLALFRLHLLNAGIAVPEIPPLEEGDPDAPRPA